MPPLSKDEIVDAIKTMSVLELSELSKQLQDVFGVSAAQAVAPSGGGGGGAALSRMPPKSPRASMPS